MTGPTRPRQDLPVHTPAPLTSTIAEEISSLQKNSQAFRLLKLPKFKPSTLPRIRLHPSKGSCSAKYLKRPYILYTPRPTAAEDRNITNKYKAPLKQRCISKYKITKNKLATSPKTTPLTNPLHIPRKHQNQTPRYQQYQPSKESHEWDIDSDEDDTVNPQATCSDFIIGELAQLHPASTDQVSRWAAMSGTVPRELYGEKDSDDE